MNDETCQPRRWIEWATAFAAARRLLLLAILAASVSACAPIWTPIDERLPRPYPMTTVELEMELPRGWMSASYPPLAGIFTFTVHGKELEEIWVRRWPRAQIVKGTNRGVSKDMTVQDIASLSLDSRRLDEGVGALRVVSNQPARVDGRECYRLDYRYRDAIGLPKRTVEYGCLVGEWLYRFEFNAAEQYYFDRYLEDFEEMTKTARFVGAGA